MSRRLHFPFVDALVEDGQIEEGTPVWIDLPSRFMGQHQADRDGAVELSTKYNSPTLTRFAMSLLCLDSYSLPGLHGKMENWDFTKLDLQVILWVNQEVQDVYEALYIIPKNYSPPSPNGLTEKAAMTTGGSSETTE